MSITSISTVAEVLAQYNNNLGWDNDITKARLALEAVRWLLVNRPQSSGINGRSLNYSALDAEKKLLEAYINQQDSISNITSKRTTFTRGLAKQW